jgi:hypothetical protein
MWPFSHMKICAITQPRATNSAALTLIKNYEGEPSKVGAMKDHRTDHLLPIIVRHRDPAPQLQLHCNKQTEVNLRTRRRRADYHNQSTSPTSLDTTIVAIETSTQTLAFHWSRLPLCSSNRQSPQEGIRHQGAAIARSQGFPPELHHEEYAKGVR